MAIYDTYAGQRLRDSVKHRAYGRCEWCWRREMHALHHRHYETYGREHPQDVMAFASPAIR
jgi:hypothetical protein